MSWVDIRDAMQAQIRANTTGMAVYDAMPADLSEDYACVVLPGDPLIEQDSHGGGDRVNIRVLARVNRGTSQDGQRALDKMLVASGDKSLRAAVDVDRSLGGAVDGCQFARVSNYGQLEGSPGAFQADVEFVVLVDNA